MNNEEIILTERLTRDAIVFPSMKPEGFQIFCVIGCIDEKFIDVTFQILRKNGEDVDGSFKLEPWGFSTDYQGDDRDELQATLDRFKEHISDKYDVKWAEMPEIKEGE